MTQRQQPTYCPLCNLSYRSYFLHMNRDSRSQEARSHSLLEHHFHCMYIQNMARRSLPVEVYKNVGLLKLPFQSFWGCVELSEHERRRRLTDSLSELELECFRRSAGWVDNYETAWYHYDPDRRHPGWFSLRPVVGRMIVSMYPESDVGLRSILLHEIGDVNVLEGVYLLHSLESLFPQGARKPSSENALGRACVVKVAGDELQKVLHTRAYNPRRMFLAKYAMMSLAAESVIVSTQSFLNRLEVYWGQHGRNWVTAPKPTWEALELLRCKEDPRMPGVGPHV